MCVVLCQDGFFGRQVDPIGYIRNNFFKMWLWYLVFHNDKMKKRKSENGMSPKEYKEPKVIHYTHGFSYPFIFPHLILISFTSPSYKKSFIHYSFFIWTN